MLDLLPAHLAHAIAARLTDARDAENALVASPALLPPALASLRVPASAQAAGLWAACWLRSPESARGLETRAVLRLDPARPTEPGAVRAALAALAATGRRVASLELAVAGAPAEEEASVAAVAVASSASVDARALFADAAELLGGSLRSVAVRGVKLRLGEDRSAAADTADAAADVPRAAAAAAAAAPRPDCPARLLLLLDALDLAGALSTPEELLTLVEAAVRPVVRATARLTVRFRPPPYAPPRERERRRLRPPAAASSEWGAALTSACAALSRDALGRPYLRELELMGLPTVDAALEGVMRCVLAAVGRGGSTAGGLSRLRLGAAAATAPATTTKTTTTAATATTTVSVVESEWTARADGTLAATPDFVSAHARVTTLAEGRVLAADAARALAAAFPSAAPPLRSVGALTLLLPPSALMSPQAAEQVSALLRECPRLRHLRLTAMATSAFPTDGQGGSPLLRAALAAVAAADPACLRTLEVCGGLATARVRAGDGAADLLAPLLSTWTGADLRRSLRSLKVTAAFAPDNSPCPLLSMAADAFPALRSMALINLLPSTSVLPTLHVADLPRGLERLDLRGWDLVRAAEAGGGCGGGGAAAPRPNHAPSAVSRLSLRGCRATSGGLAAAARALPGVTDAALCGFDHGDEREADGVARAWPRLTALTIAGGGGGGGGGAAVPALLPAAARLCPLREVRLQGLGELDVRALAEALLPAARTLRCLEVAAAANAPASADAKTEGGGDDDEAAAARTAAAAAAASTPDAAGVARALAPLEALRRLRVKAPGWRSEARAALAHALARPWLLVETAVGAPRLSDARRRAADVA